MDDVDAALHYLGAACHHNDDYLLYDRKAKCFQATNKAVEATELFNKALEAAASSATVPDMMREAFQKQVQQNLDKLAVKISENGKNEDDPEPTTFEISLDHPH